MDKLASLIQKADYFYKLSMLLSEAAEPWSMPDDPAEDETEIAEPPYFADLISIAHQVDDPGLSQQLAILAELYKYSIQMGGGYATIAKAINNVKMMYGDDTVSNIEFILNGMIGELARAAGGPGALAARDNPNFVQRLVQLKQDIEARDREQQSEALNTYQEEISMPGAAGEAEEDLTESGLDAEPETTSPAALGYADKDDPRANPGWHPVGPDKPYKNWSEYYDNEGAAYIVDLQQQTDPDVKSILEQLIALLPQLSQKTAAALELSNDLRTNGPNPNKEQKLEELRNDLRKLKKERLALKKKIRHIKLTKERAEIVSELNSTPESNFWARELLEQKLAVNALTQSTDRLKSKERNLRLHLIEYLEAKHFPSQKDFEKLKANILLASQERITQEAYDRKRTEERGKQQARLETPSYEATRGGPRIPMEYLPPEQQIDLEKASFKNLVYQFGIDVNSAVQAARQAIYEYREGKVKKRHAHYKEKIDKISEAIRKRDRQTLYAAQQDLKTAVEKEMLVDKRFLKGYVEIIKLAPHFKKVEEEIKNITKPKSDSAGDLIVEDFDDADKEALAAIIRDMHRLRTLYATYSISFPGITRFKDVILDMGRIETYLALKLHVHKPEGGRKSSPERSKLLKQIWQDLEKQDPLRFKKLKEQWESKGSIDYRKFLLSRVAQEAAPSGEIDEATANRLANEIFNKIFDEAYQQMLNELQA